MKTTFNVLLIDLSTAAGWSHIPHTFPQSKEGLFHGTLPRGLFHGTLPRHLTGQAGHPHLRVADRLAAVHGHLQQW